MINIALVGGTHGNEPVGLEVMRLLENSRGSFRNSHQGFWSNPRAYELKKRYVDTDLNRAFGTNAILKGYEALRAEELTNEIKGHFDLCIDLHTTTSNMGLTVILNNTHPSTRKACAYLLKVIPGIKLIEEDRLDEECNHLNRLCPAGITVEVGPVANNVISGELVFAMRKIVEKILNFDFDSTPDFSKVTYYKMLDTINYPDEDHWYIHPEVDENDFRKLEKGDPVFIHESGEVKKWEGETIYPFFINEAAYLEKKSAFLTAEKRTGF